MRGLPLHLARSHKFHLLIDLDIQDLLVEHNLGIMRLLVTFIFKILPGFLHLFQITHPCHVKNVRGVADAPILVPQLLQLVIHLTLVFLGAGAWKPLHARTLLVGVIFWIVGTLQPAVLKVE